MCVRACKNMCVFEMMYVCVYGPDLYNGGGQGVRRGVRGVGGRGVQIVCWCVTALGGSGVCNAIQALSESPSRKSSATAAVVGEDRRYLQMQQPRLPPIARPSSQVVSRGAAR